MLPTYEVETEDRHHVMEKEQRRFRRLPIQLPAECKLERGERTYLFRTVSRNISTGGIYLELEAQPDGHPPEMADTLDLVLTVPPGDGYSPYEGQVMTTGKVVHRKDLSVDSSENEKACQRIGLGIRFQQPLKFTF